MATNDNADAAAAAAAERKRKRLEAWRKRQQQQQKQQAQQINDQVQNAKGGFQTTILPTNSASATSKAEATVQGSAHPKVKIGLGLSNIKGRKKKKSSKNIVGAVGGVRVGDLTSFLGGEEKKNLDDEDLGDKKSVSLPMLEADELIIAPPESQKFNDVDAVSVKPTERSPNDAIENGGVITSGEGDNSAQPVVKRRRRGRWDLKDKDTAPTFNSHHIAAVAATEPVEAGQDVGVNDELDAFMMRLEAGAAAGDDIGTVSNNNSKGADVDPEKSKFHIDSAGSMVRLARNAHKSTIKSSSSLSITAPSRPNNAPGKPATSGYTFSDWESDAPPTPHTPSGNETEQETDDEEEEKARRAFIDALKKSAPPPSADYPSGNRVPEEEDEYETKSAVKSEKERREDHVRKLEEEANKIRKSAHVAVETGRLYNDDEGGIMDEAERSLAALTAMPDALEVLAEMNKRKELRAVDHDKIDYLPVRKNLYIVPQSLAKLSSIEVAEKRAKLGVKVRGKGAPAPVSTFREAGVSERIMSVLEKKGIVEPFPVQAQCLPCIMAGRDVIGIAKTGSGKTLAFCLPMFRHIMDQPPLAPGETGPIGLVLAPARELAYQIHAVCKGFSKHLGLKSTAVYGGAGVAEQIGDLKRGTHILCATPGRLIDILTMQSGKLISLQRVSVVCLDESDRAFDMGFEPQISAILSAVRPDRQTVMFSATFPKTVENLARKALRAPLEIIVGGRSVASDSVDQYAEVVEEEDKFLRLLQLLGEHADGDKKVIIFVGRQDQADSLFEQLVRCGYSSLSIHGGMDQEDRDSNMSDFKRADGPTVLVATSVAGRGLDVPSCGCVINYSSPNHLEDYVHRVGRTGRASNRGVSYTFVNSTDEAKFAPIIVRALIESGQSKNISEELKVLSDSFKEKVAKGEARWASSGYKGKGYTYDSSEMNDAQKLARLEKRQALIEAGLLDPDEEEGDTGDKDDNIDDNGVVDIGKSRQDVPSKAIEKKDAVGMLANVSSDVLAIPGMREALMRKAGMLPEEDTNMLSTGENHFVEELEINDYPREARWKVTQKETTSRLQDEFQTAVTLKGQYIEPGKTPAEGDRKLYLHLEAQSRQILQNCIVEIKRLLNEETLRVGARSLGGGHRYNVLS
mmetsp:Transcript_5864/g.12024  ORF Transcript_5864/g.12024 Transcript_5864/m.12024 type:complete len:1140 (+) Transcript_5864:36-3455(+)